MRSHSFDCQGLHLVWHPCSGTPGISCCHTEESYGSQDTAVLCTILIFSSGPIAGRAALTDNFDACRDLSGRRMRHVNADKKLADWAAHARDRELQKAAAKNLREQERAAQQEVEQQVRLLPPGTQLLLLKMGCQACTGARGCSSADSRASGSAAGIARLLFSDAMHCQDAQASSVLHTGLVFNCGGAVQVDMDDVKVAQDAALANVLSAVESALASAPAKRKPEAGQPSMLPAKRQKASGHMLGLDADLSSDSEEEQDDASDAGANPAGAAPTCAAIADAPGQTAKGPGAVKEIVIETVQVSALEAQVPGDSSSLDSEQEALHSLAEPAQPAHGSSSALEVTPVPQATEPSQPQEVSALPLALILLGFWALFNNILSA